MCTRSKDRKLSMLIEIYIYFNRPIVEVEFFLLIFYQFNIQTHIPIISKL